MQRNETETIMEEEEVEEEEDTSRINPGPAVTNNLTQQTIVFQYPPNKSPPVASLQSTIAKPLVQ
jgi:hypothetical protein